MLLVRIFFEAVIVHVIVIALTYGMLHGPTDVV